MRWKPIWFILVVMCLLVGLEGGQRTLADGTAPPRFPARPSEPVEATAEAIAKAVADLGSASHGQREQASARLFWMGEAARGALVKAGEDGDAEVRARVREVISLLDALVALEPARFSSMIPGYFVATSRLKDVDALGGFAPSGNLSRPMVAFGLKPQQRGLFLLAEPERLTVFRQRHRGMRVLLVNDTEDMMVFAAQDSRLDVVAEARNEAGEWTPIESLPRSFCGNSYHRVSLPAGEMWAFSAPLYEGERRTQVRFRLPRKGGTFIYSNIFEAGLNPGQFISEEDQR